MTNNDKMIASLEDPAERKWLTEVTPEAIRDNAHRIYEFMTEAGIPQDSWTRELAFAKASERLNLDYEVLYDAWLEGRPVAPAAG